MPICNRCEIEFDVETKPGALMFGHPSTVNETVFVWKAHICQDCENKIVSEWKCKPIIDVPKDEAQRNRSGFLESPSGQALSAAEAIWKRMVGTKPFPLMDTIPIAKIIDFHMRSHVASAGVVVDKELERRLAQEGLQVGVPCTPNIEVGDANIRETSVASSGSVWRPRPGSVFDGLDDEHKNKWVKTLKYFRNQRTCNVCGRQWNPKEDIGKCLSCGSTSYRQRVKPNARFHRQYVVGRWRCLRADLWLCAVTRFCKCVLGFYKCVLEWRRKAMDKWLDAWINAPLP